LKTGGETGFSDDLWQVAGGSYDILSLLKDTDRLFRFEMNPFSKNCNLATSERKQRANRTIFQGSLGPLKGENILPFVI